MRRPTFALLLLVASASSALAQERPPVQRVLVAAGYGIGLTSGSSYIGGSNAGVEVFQGSVTGVINPEQGVALTAFRLQTILPSHGQFRDPAYDNPLADGLVLSYAGLTQDRHGGPPAQVQLG